MTLLIQAVHILLRAGLKAESLALLEVILSLLYVVCFEDYNEVRSCPFYCTGLQSQASSVIRIHCVW